MAKNESKTSWQKVVGGSLIGSLLVGLIALAFIWPAKTAVPHEVPIAVTGSNPQQVEAIEKNIETNAGGKIKLVSAASRDDAINKMKNREVYGALVLAMPNPEVLTASANGAALNGIITSMASKLQADLPKMVAARVPAGVPAPQITLKTTDVIPAYNATFDIAQVALPLVFGGMIGGVLLAVLVHGRWQRLVALALFAVFASNVMYLILSSWFNVLPADYWAITGAFSFGIFATSSFIVGSYVLVGVPGLALAAAFTMLIANPISGIALPALFLPEPWGVIGQWLTIGASGTLLRTAVYFPVASVLTVPLIVLGLWSMVGIVATIARDRDSLRG